MNYDSDSDRSNSIVGFKKSQNKTGTDYRTNFALDAAHLLALRTLCNHVSDDECGGKEGEGEGTLAAVEGGTGRVFMWRVGRVDGGVPRRAFPVCVIGSPGAGMGLGLGERSKLVQLAFVVGRGEGGEEVVDGGEDMGGESSAELGIVVGHGDWTAAYAIPQEALL